MHTIQALEEFIGARTKSEASIGSAKCESVKAVCIPAVSAASSGFGDCSSRAFSDADAQAARLRDNKKANINRTKILRRKSDAS
jgi:hypothetical protein